MSALAQVAVRERPIICSGPMVGAILDGTKTQTRRVVADSNTQGNWKASQMDLSRAWVDPGPSPTGNAGPYLKSFLTPDAAWRIGEEPDAVVDRLYPRWWPGERLWVREAHTFVSDGFGIRPGIAYQADDTTIWRDSLPDGTTVYNLDSPATLKWRPSIFMPRWASRITLELTGVRVERVQDISYADVIAEGCPTPAATLASPEDHDWYIHLWDSLNKSRGYGWDVNPWVWVLEFTKVRA